MPTIFKPSVIKNMQASDVTQELVDYYNRLSDTRKEEFAESRPDLYSAILVWEKSAEEKQAEEALAEEEITVEIPEDEEITDDPDLEAEENDREWQAVQKNAYIGKDIPRLIEYGLKPLEALTISDTDKCPVHHSYLKKYIPKFYKRGGAVMGLNLYHCKDCNRLFIAKSEFDYNDKNLNDWGVPHTFYSYEISRRYLKTQMKPHVLEPEEEIYWVDPWIEEHPVCPVHDSALEEITCLAKYQKKTAPFDAYYCESCRKVILRKTKAILLEDQLAQAGIPSDRFVRLVKRSPAKKAVPRRNVKPDYYLDSGKKSEYTFEQVDNCYYLTEEDTVVVSYGIYCSLDEHDTQTVLGLIWVKEKNRGRRSSYMVMLGYCAECNKFYMNQTDYQTIYRNGRPEVRVIINLEDNSYMITSGDVFNIERDHLQSVENRIDNEVKKIHSHPDYVNIYATSPYNDEGDLQDKKDRSIRVFEPQLRQLAAYKPQPYQYYVEISAEGKKEKYYIGSSEIILDRKQEVMAVGSKLGRELVNYRTVKVTKDGNEYRISLSRQFDINNGALYGYTNLRTDEDAVFRKGITDPFLVRVLNMRRRQHELIDIFVTIQENQNTIVDADFNNNLIVQGCAGSGKTMVLLHRLSALKYTESDFDYSNNALILTPNDHFTLHINGLAESLQIDSIRRISVERYYARMLEQYSDDLKATGPITSEMNVQQSFVDYIYSDDFRADFQRNYNTVIHARNQIIPLLEQAAEALNVELNEIEASNDSEVIPQLEKALSIITAKININENELAKTAESLQKTLERKERLAADIKKSSVEASSELRQAAHRVQVNVSEALAEREQSIQGQKLRLSKMENDREKLFRRIEAADENEDVAFDVFVAENQDLINEPVSSLIDTINEHQKDYLLSEEEKKHLTELLDIPYEEVISSASVNDDEITNLLSELTSARNTLEQLQQEKTRAENGWIFGRARRITNLTDRIAETETLINSYENSVLELLANRRTELAALSEMNELLNREIATLFEKVKKLIAVNGKNRLSAMDEQISVLSKWIEDQSSELSRDMNIANQLNEEMGVQEILEWINVTSSIVPGVMDSLVPYNRIVAENKRYRTQYAGIDNVIQEAQSAYNSRLANRYSVEIKNTVNDLREKIAGYNVGNTYQIIFENTVKPFMAAHRIKAVSGRNHRYDLYAKLVFAMEYYQKAHGKAKLICIDEGQDLAVNEYRLIRQLNGEDVVLNIFGDTNQLMKPNRGIEDWSKLKTLFPFEQYTLNENYRNTNQITRYCNDSFNMSMLQTGVDGPKVREITKAEFEEELANIQIGNDRVAVLLPRSVQKKTYINQSRLSDEVEESISEKIGSDNIAIMYVDEVKGIEFDKVYVVSKDMGRNEKYIAYTRALNELILVVDDSALLR